MTKYSDNYVASLEKQVARAAKQKLNDDNYIAALQEQCRVADDLIKQLQRQVELLNALQKSEAA